MAAIASAVVLGFFAGASHASAAECKGKRVLMPLPTYGFDPTESAVPWSKLVQKGHCVTFATPNGQPANADAIMLTGDGLPHVWKLVLRAKSEAVALYDEMTRSAEFRRPIPYGKINPGEYDALLLTGGHEKGMRDYLGSEALQKNVAAFFDRRKLVGAICHGTLLAARSHSTRTGGSVLNGRKSTGLTLDLEMFAYQVTKRDLGDYYRTYAMPLEQEVIASLGSRANFIRGPGSKVPFVTRDPDLIRELRGLGVPAAAFPEGNYVVPPFRDSDANLRPGFVVRDGNYLSARWPGDAYAFSRAFVLMLESGR